MMTPYVWLNFIIILAADITFCGAMYLTYEAIEDVGHWLNPKPTINTKSTPIVPPPTTPKMKVNKRIKWKKLAGVKANSHILSIIKSSL